jgi:CheY-like chemotaxis protein
MTGPSRRILVVDDDDRVRQVLQWTLQALGQHYEILAVGNGLEALDVLSETRIDLLITDLRLPRMDGLALTSAFAKLSPTTKVIWVTANGCHRFREFGQELGISQCLNKPLEIQDLRTSTLQVLNGTFSEQPSEPSVDVKT